MHIQTTLGAYYQCKSSGVSPVTRNMSDKSHKKKRKSLTLIKPLTPKKNSKTEYREVFKESGAGVIDLTSDDEMPSSTNSHENNCELSRSSIKSETSPPSDSTVIYNLTPSTPQISPKESLPGSLSSNKVSPPSRAKYYSPTKNRAVYKKSLVKRNLDFSISKKTHPILGNASNDEDIVSACEEMDDKSIFFLSIINKCIKDVGLKALLDEDSQKLLSSCLHIIKPGARLICRLYWRQHTWYKKEKLLQIICNKKSINEEKFVEILNCLVENKFIIASTADGNDSMSFDDFTKVLKSGEIQQLCKFFKLNCKNKEDAVKALRNYSRKSSIGCYFKPNSSKSDNLARVMNQLRSRTGTCYKLSSLAAETIHKLYVLMFLGMNYAVIREKGLELKLINEKINRETYPIDKEMALDNAAVVFRNSEEFDKYFKAHNIYEEFLTTNVTADKCNITLNVYELYNDIQEEDMNRYKSLPSWLRRYTPANIYVKIMESGVQELKKNKTEEHYQQALDILTTLISQASFRQHKKPEWYAEKALILQRRLARHDEACAVVLEALNSGMSEDAKGALCARAEKLKLQLPATVGTQLDRENSFPADHIVKHHEENVKLNNRGKKMFEYQLGDEKGLKDAENYCIFYYITNGLYTHGKHWEGRIVTTIFFLLFWDIIYKKPRGAVGVFLSRYQLFPLDMFCESFYINRKEVIDERIEAIANMELDTLINEMQTKWNERPESEVSGINRDIGWDNISMVVSCLGARATAALCRRLARDYGHSHSGFPDLTLWDIHTRKIKFVEVKTDTDKPSLKQLRWLQYLRENRIDAAFCYLGARHRHCPSDTGQSVRRSDTSTQLEHNPNVTNTQSVETPAILNTQSVENATVRNTQSNENLNLLNTQSNQNTLSGNVNTTNTQLVENPDIINAPSVVNRKITRQSVKNPYISIKSVAAINEDFDSPPDDHARQKMLIESVARHYRKKSKKFSC